MSRTGSAHPQGSTTIRRPVAKGRVEDPSLRVGYSTRQVSAWPNIESALEGSSWSVRHAAFEEGSSWRCLSRLRERRLARWLLAYLAMAWMVLQITDALREIWNWPIGLPQGITLALGLGVLPAAVVAWYHGEKGRQRVCVCEVAVIATLIAGCAWVIWTLT